MRRSHFLISTRGFSLTGTLVAVAVGAIVAALITSIITQAVRGKRSVVERDEVSEFTDLIKKALTSDTTCNAALFGKNFSPGGKSDLVLTLSYADQGETEIKKGFTFAGDNYEIQDFTIEDQTPNPVAFKILIEDEGKVKESTVRRHVARIRMKITSRATGASYRERFFEVPLLYNVGDERIEMCNNEINIGDACQAMGFRWDSTSSPPKCEPANSCLYGGAYTLTSSGGCVANPATGTCSCPSGPGTSYQAVAAGSVNIQRTGCFKGCDPFHFDVVYQCFWCPR
jgi:hypothetical protein